MAPGLGARENHGGEQKMICFYHRDLDGKCSAAIVLRAEPECTVVPVDYRNSVPIERVEKDEEVIIVDFSLEHEDAWERLLRRTEDVTWIDHHESAMNKATALKLDDLPGVRKIGESGCLLAWKWFNSGKPVPKAVELINQWDLWTHGDDPDVLNFIYGLKIEDTHPPSRLWDSLFGSAQSIGPIQQNGKIIERYQRKLNRGYLKTFAFDVQFHGYHCVACNIGLAGSKLFDSMKTRGYDIFITFVYDGRQYSVNLFSDTVPVNTIAEQYGGGGHTGAAGFTCQALPFGHPGKTARP